MKKNKNITYKLLDMLNYIALCIVSNTANKACDWLYFQDEEPDAVKKYRKF